MNKIKEVSYNLKKDKAALRNNFLYNYTDFMY